VSERILDLASLPRRGQYEFFRGLAQPHFSLCATVDATRLIEVLKPAGVSPFHAALWCLLDAANAVPELRTRFRGDVVVEHEAVHASVTVPIGPEAFAFCSIRHDPNWASFDAACAAAIEAARRQDALEENTSGDEWIYLSCLPWVHFSAMTNPTGGPEDCVPRVTWGRFEQREGRWEIPVAVQVHHALVDGVHLGRFYEGVEQRLAELPLPEGDPE